MNFFLGFCCGVITTLSVGRILLFERKLKREEEECFYGVSSRRISGKSENVQSIPKDSTDDMTFDDISIEEIKEEEDII